MTRNTGERVALGLVIGAVSLLAGCTWLTSGRYPLVAAGLAGFGVAVLCVTAGWVTGTLIARHAS